MQAIKHAPTDAVVQVVTPAKPETFDLIGLSVDDMALLLVVLGHRAGTIGLPNGLYDTIYDALDMSDHGGYSVQSSNTTGQGKLFSYTVTADAIERVKAMRNK